MTVHVTWVCDTCGHRASPNDGGTTLWIAVVVADLWRHFCSAECVRRWVQ